MFKWLEKKLNKRNMEKKAKDIEKSYDDSLCHHCAKHKNCIYEDGIPIVRCPEYKKRIVRNTSLNAEGK